MQIVYQYDKEDIELLSRQRIYLRIHVTHVVIVLLVVVAQQKLNISKRLLLIRSVMC